MPKRDVYEPFNADVETHGGYQYANTTRRSSVCANRRFSDVIIAAAQLDGKQVVDVGCGDGTYTAVLRAETNAEHILGIDPAAKAIELASKRDVPSAGGLEFRSCLAADLVAEGQHFDVAVYRGVIHHVGDPAAELATALQLADTVFLLEPNGWNPVLKLIERFSAYHREHAEQSYRLGTYGEWFRAGGGHVQRASFFGLVPMFCPDWFVTLAQTLEPIVERLPGLRALACGQIGVLASSTSTTPE